MKRLLGNPVSTLGALVAPTVAVLLALPGGAGATTIERVSIAPSGAQANSPAANAVISGDGSRVAFVTASSSFGASQQEAFLRDRAAGVTRALTPGVDAPVFMVSISGDGRWVAFDSTAQNLAPRTGLGAQVYLQEVSTGKTKLVSQIDGAQLGSAAFPHTSSTGAITVFSTVDPDQPWLGRVGVYDRAADRTRLYGTGADDVADPSVSADGRTVVFSGWTEADASARVVQVYALDLASGAIERVSSAPGGAAGDGNSTTATVSGDGRYVAYLTVASNLVGAQDPGADLLVHDRQTGSTVRANIGPEGQRVSPAPWAGISPSGRSVVFVDSGSYNALLLRRLDTGTTTRLDIRRDGFPSEGAIVRYNGAISADDRFVAFESRDPGLVADDTNATYDAFVADLGDPRPDCTAVQSVRNRVSSLARGLVGRNETCKGDALPLPGP
jgi:Tol biopolymer transport system component